MLSRDQILKLASVKSGIPLEKIFEQTEFLTQRFKILPWWFLKFWEIKLPCQFYEFQQSWTLREFVIFANFSISIQF